MHNPCAVIPVYNHETAVPAVVDALLAAGLPCVLVDDASSPACSAVLEQLAQGDNIFLIRLAVNQGKGGAVMAGLREASQLGQCGPGTGAGPGQPGADGQAAGVEITGPVAAAEGCVRLRSNRN